MKNTYSRREFIKSTSAATMGVAIGATALAPKSYSRIIGANDRINFAIIGLHGRGNGHLSAIAACKNTNVSHICDVDRRELDRFSADVLEKTGIIPVQEKDIRILLESKDVDVITVATPEHWHTPMALMGLQSGKHVYLEKPSSHNPAEGELLVSAQKKYGKLIQMGNQQRSSAHTIEAINKIHSGEIGTPYFGKAWYSNTRKSIGRGKHLPVPDYLDWDLWQGPAPRVAYKDIYHPYNWHWFWRWGTGETLNNGTHEVDLCRWALKVNFPNRISATGGRYHFDDDWEFYDTLITNFEYDDKMITWEGKSCQGKRYYGRGRGATIHGTEGTVLIDRDGYEIYNLADEKVFEFITKQKDGSMDVIGEGPMTDAHFQNLLDAIREGKRLRSPIDEGNISVTMLLLSNIAWKTGRVLNLDTSNGHIINEKLAMEMLWGREYEPGWEPEI